MRGPLSFLSVISTDGLEMAAFHSFLIASPIFLHFSHSFLSPIRTMMLEISGEDDGAYGKTGLQAG